jgi:Fe-S oxidoreductase/nitrate reductase gamma subunit
MVATREVYWNIEGEHWMYLLFVLALVAFGYGVYQRVKLWKLGSSENRWGDAWQGIKNIFVYSLVQKRVLKEGYMGIMHLSLFVGFLFLAFATAIITLQADLGLQIFKGYLYIFIKITSNLFGLAAVIAILMAAYRRYIVRAKEMNNKPDDAITLLLIFVILITGFVIEGVRMAADPGPYDIYGFAGLWLAPAFRAMLSVAQLEVLHRGLWWFHLVLAMIFIGYMPYSKMFHIVLAPVNHFFRKQGPLGVPTLIDFEDESLEKYGVSSLRELSWKTLFNTDVCLRCGRCQDNCPAYLSGKHLNPKQAIQDIRGLMEEEGAAIAQLKKTGGVTEAACATDGGGSCTEQISSRTLVGDVIPEADLWACTTCRACEQSCPVFVEHVDKTIDMRRHLVLDESRFPSQATLAFRNMEGKGNPWGLPRNTRGTFLTDMGVQTIAENPTAEILYFAGCSASYDARNQKVAAAVVTLLRAAGVNFAILGNEEDCCGDSARKLGNELLFQSLASGNIETMKGYGVKKVVTACPHCFNMMKNEYPQLGGDFEVVHHTTFFKELATQGKLKLGKAAGKTVTYHDSCYLGRYNNIYNDPRELFKTVGLNITEMERHGEKGFCCGAGGGAMWLEEHEGDRINFMRTDQAVAIADLVGTACPFCLTMINDGIKARELTESKKVMDIAEILAEVL